MMKLENDNLVISQMDLRIKRLKKAADTRFQQGWVNAIRKAIKMSRRQLADRMDVSISSVQSLERNEQSGTVTLNTLREAAEALGMDLVYGLVPREGSLKNKIKARAKVKAREITRATNHSLELEDQLPTEKRSAQLEKEVARQLQRKLSKNLWD